MLIQEPSAGRTSITTFPFRKKSPKGTLDHFNAAGKRDTSAPLSLCL